MFSGFTRGYDQSGEYTGEEDQENITFFGACDNALLSMRIIMPPLLTNNPADNTPRQFIGPANQNWDVWRYPEDNSVKRVSEVMYTTLADNISFRAPRLPTQNPNTLDRNIRELYIKKPGVLGPRATLRGRYQNLLTKMQELSYFPGNDTYQRNNRSYTGLQFRTLQLDRPLYAYTGPENIINTRVPKSQLPPNQPAPPVNSQEKKVQTIIKKPEDKRDTVVFSKGLKNLGSYRFKLQAPQSTYVVLGGQNNACTVNDPVLGNYQLPAGAPGTYIALPDSNPRTRWFSHMGANNPNLRNLVSQYGLWETFLDRRDIQYGNIQDQRNVNAFPIRPSVPPGPVTNANRQWRRMDREFKQAMQTELIENRDLLEIEVEVINITPTIWSEDYNIGDIVTVVIPGETQEIVGKVKEVTVTLTKDEGEVVKTVVGTETQPNGRDLFSKVINVNKKTNFLEELR